MLMELQEKQMKRDLDPAPGTDAAAPNVQPMVRRRSSFLERRNMSARSSSCVRFGKRPSVGCGKNRQDRLD
jgi:hypothetical protein